MKIGMHYLRLFILISLISILSITGLYVYAVTLDITPIAQIDNDDDGDTLLDGPMDIAITTIAGKTYAVVSSNIDNGIEIIDISDPTSPTSVSRVADGTDTDVCTVANGEKCLDAANGNAITTIDGSTYVVVTAADDDGIEIIDISDPTNPTSVGRVVDGTDTGVCTVANGEKCLDGAKGVRTTTINDKTYAIVAAEKDDGIEIIDISDPTNPTSVSRVVDGTDTGVCTVANGERCLDGVRQLTTAEVGDIGATSGTYYVITVARNDDGIGIIDISDPENPTYVASLTDDNASCSDSNCELDNPSYVAPISTIGSSTYVLVASERDDGIQIIRLCESCEVVVITSSTTASTSTSTSSTCTRHIILGNCGTIEINNDVYRIIDPWSTIPTTEVMVGKPVSITLSTPHNYAAGKINSASVYTEIFGSPTNYELGSHIDYSVTKNDYYVSESELFQVVGATHRIVQDPDVKNLKMFEVVFTMVFAKPMDTSYIVVETKNMHGIPETIYLRNALKVIERPIELLTMEEKSKFEIIYEPELKASLRPDIDIEPDMDMLAVDPEPVVSKATCGKGTMLKDNLCVPNEMSFYFFVNQFMRFFG